MYLERDYLLNFHNCNIRIDDRIYYNKESKFKQNFVTASNLMINGTIDQLTFDELVLGQIENIEEIKEK